MRVGSVWNDPSPPLRPKDEPRSLYRMTAPTHYGYTTFPGIEKIYLFGFKEVNTGFRPTLELIEIGSAPRQDADTWTYHPCVPDNRLPGGAGVPRKLMAVSIRAFETALRIVKRVLVSARSTICTQNPTRVPRKSQCDGAWR